MNKLPVEEMTYEEAMQELIEMNDDDYGIETFLQAES